MALAAPVIAVGAIYLLGRPAAALALLLGVVTVIEGDPVGLLPIGPQFYRPVASNLTPPDLLLMLLLGAVLVELARSHTRPRMPDPFTIPLLVLAAAVAAGVITGLAGGAEAGPLVAACVILGHLLLLPFLVVNVLQGTAALRVFAIGAAALAGFKAVSGLAASAAGAGVSVSGGTITFPEPLANWLLLMFLLAMVAARQMHVPLPSWVWWAAPIAFTAFALSYRRSFWLGAVLALIVVLVVTSRTPTRAAAAICAVALALAAVGSLTFGQSTELEHPVVERARSLEPGEITNSKGDRYRIDERNNVIAELRNYPLTGLGLAVPWRAREPLSEEHDRKYTHIVALWYWLKLGLLGLIAYLGLMGTALWTALAVWRRHPDQLTRVAAAAALGGLVALSAVELTASFTGVEVRLTIAFAALLGWLSAAWSDLDPSTRAV